MAKTKNPKIEKGTISVSTEDIFPIIKRSLYSDQEIFLRELISNGIDAMQKLKYLSGKGEFEGEMGDLEINVTLDKEAKTLTISDMGIGMSAEEVKKYINQVAFSGAEEFVKKFKEAEQSEDIIGKFGLGFYSAFMVSKEVEIITKSYREGDEAVRWTCDGTTSYTIEPTTREKRGTDVILHISEDEEEEYLEEARIKTILNKYCRFLPIPIKFNGEQINNPHPIWRKKPTELTDEDYQSFFKELYPYAEDPLFWIHLNVDYPFNLTGILYFPRIKKDIDPQKNQIQLYSRQVFITDEVKDIVPEYLMLLKGVIDSPDIPLNVSRSYLQGDSSVKKISDYITKKVADKLNELYKEDAAKFEEKWDDVSVFVKYGMLTDDKFFERAEKFCLLQNIEGASIPIETYREKIAPLQTDKDENVVFLYTSDKNAQDLYIQSAVKKGYDVLDMDGVIDSHFIGLMERKMEKARWIRVDSDTVDNLIQKEGEKPSEGITLTEEQSTSLKEVFEKARSSENIIIQTENLGADQFPVIITRNEFMRRMKEQAAMGGGGMAMMGNMPESFNAVVNTQHPLVAKMVDGKGDVGLAKQLLDLALLSQNMLTGKELTGFIQRSIDMIGKEAGSAKAKPAAKKPAAKKAAPKKPAAEKATEKKPAAKKTDKK